MDDNFENLKENSNSADNEPGWGGAREGAGRKPGSENSDKKEQREALRKFKERVRKRVDRLFNAQLALAEGLTYLYRVDEETGADGKKKRVHVLVTDPDEIKQFLDGDYEKEEHYYYITTKDPDNKAIDSMLDRTFGKATQVHSLDEDSEPLSEVIVKIIQTNEQNSNGSNRGVSEDSTGGGEIQNNMP